jgi:galactokinase
MSTHIDANSATDAALRKATAAFTEQFGGEPSVAVRAPGRVNLIGEHTDYNDGFVLPIALDLATVIVARLNGSQRCRVIAADIDGGEMSTFFANDTLAPSRTQWTNYIKGVIRQFVDAGHHIPAFDAAISSTVPLGSGLSSSAALEVATATLMESLLQIRLEPTRKAQWCQKAEHTFAGTPCGILDQMASICGQRGSAVLLDCRTLQTTLVPIEDDAIAFVVSNTNVKHELSGGEYGVRREQCEAAVKIMRRTHHNLCALRDATLSHLAEYENVLDPVLFRRARHVISENERTLLMAKVLPERDYVWAGQLINESHRSLALDYEVSCRELDIMADLAQDFDGVFGSRMTGGGFGGCTVTLVRSDRADTLIQHLTAEYPKRTNLPATCFQVTPACGAGVIGYNGGTPGVPG